MDLFSIVQAAEEASHASSDPSIAGMFGLNWQLFVAQLINFGIVMLVLWKWVFIPVTRALEKRTKRIEDSLKNAELVDTQKKEFEAWKAKEVSETKKQAGEILATAKTDADKLKDDILAQAKSENEKILETGRNSLKQEKDQILQETKAELVELATQMAEKILQREITGKDNETLTGKAMRAIKTNK